MSTRQRNSGSCIDIPADLFSRSFFSRSWDEYVPPSRLLKLTEASFLKQRQLVDAARQQRFLEAANQEAEAAAAAAAAAALAQPIPVAGPSGGGEGALGSGGGGAGPSTTKASSSHPIASGSGGGRNKGREEMISGSSHGPRKRAREGESVSLWRRFERSGRRGRRRA